MIKVNLQKARDISHEIRREKRAAEFAPLDVKATIPSEAASAELQRQAVRDKYKDLQKAIENANDIDELKAVIDNLIH
jgi:hypothetical protein